MNTRIVSSARIASRLLVALFAAVTCIGIALVGARAVAVFEEIAETGTPGYLRLSVDSETPLWAELAPGESMRWLVEARLQDAPVGSLSVELRAAGTRADLFGMTARVDACGGSFSLGDDGEPTCHGEAQVVIEPSPLTQFRQHGDRFELAELYAAEPRELLVTLELPEHAREAIETDAAGSPLAHVGLGVHATGASGGDAPVKPTPGGAPSAGPPSLALTGGDALALGLLALGLAGLGTALALRGRSAS